MRATLDWSYALLGAGEMRLFRACSVFRGGFDATAAAALLSPAGAQESLDVDAALSGLVDASIVLPYAGADGRGRYRLLDVTREYAVERATAAGEFSELRRRHAEHFLALAERAEPELRRSEQREWHARLLQEEANLRAAQAWAIDSGEAETALRFAGALWMFWRWAGLFLEGRAWVEAALAAGTGCACELRCQAMWGAGWLAYHQGDYRHTAELGEQMLRLLEGGDDPLLRRNALTLVGNAALGEDRHDDAIRALGDALQCVTPLGGTWHLATSLLNLGSALIHAERAADALPLLNQALAIYEDLGDRHFTGRVLVQRAFAASATGDLAGPVSDVERAMGMFAELGDAWAIAEGMESMAVVLSGRSPRKAAVLAGAAERLREWISMRPHPTDAAVLEGAMQRARTTLGDAGFQAARAEGRGLASEEAVAMALAADLGAAVS